MSQHSFTDQIRKHLNLNTSALRQFTSTHVDTDIEGNGDVSHRQFQYYIHVTKLLYFETSSFCIGFTIDPKTYALI